jgi:hypothetical protein
LPSEVVYSSDSGATWGESAIASMALSDQAIGAECVGTRLVVISNNGLAHNYASLSDIVSGAASWVEVTGGYVVSKGPNAIFSLGSTLTWIAGNGGYIYFSEDITAAVEVQLAGTITVQNLLAIHGSDSRNLVAVGASNAIVNSRNGGQTWASVTGPAAGVALNAVWVRSAEEWLVGTAGGKLYFTRNSGVSWTEIAFPGSGAGQVRDIRFASPTVGYLAHDTADPRGRILRTIDGGNSWYVLPEEEGIAFPLNDRINSIAACGDDVNVVFGGGLGDNGTDGFLVKAA